MPANAGRGGKRRRVQLPPIPRTPRKDRERLHGRTGNMDNATAREVFARDIALVLENDYNSYKVIRDEAIRLNNPYTLAEFIRNHVEALVEESIKAHGGTGALLIRQLCHGWSLDAYADYARDILESERV